MATGIKIKKLSKEVAERGKEFIKKATVVVEVIKVKRDELRTLVSEYSEVLDSIDGAEREWTAALDTLSQYL